jgi:hypothetical protein
MRDGKLLAMDTPSVLKSSALPGLAWDVFVDWTGAEGTSPILVALEALETCPCVLRAGLTGDHLRAITPFDVSAETLKERLDEAGVAGVAGLRVEPVEPTLEDVFLALAAK